MSDLEPRQPLLTYIPCLRRAAMAMAENWDQERGRPTMGQSWKRVRTNVEVQVNYPHNNETASVSKVWVPLLSI